MKQMVHDNINQFVGICFDKRTDFYAIWHHCSRGTLADVIFSNNTALRTDKLSDENGQEFQEIFKRAFVRDIIRVCFLNCGLLNYHQKKNLTIIKCNLKLNHFIKYPIFDQIF